MISPSVLASLRAQREASFASICRVERRQTTLDAAGQPSTAWTTLVASAPCGVALQAATFRALPAAVGQQVDARIHLPLSLAGTVSADDRIVVTSAYGQATTEQAFEVVHVLPQALTLRCDCRRLEAR